MIFKVIISIFIIHFVFCMQGFSSEDIPIAEQYKGVEGQIMDSMRRAVGEAEVGDDDLVVLEKVSAEIDKDSFRNIPLDADLPIDECVKRLYQLLPGSADEDLSVRDPQTVPMGGAEAVRILGTPGEAKAAIKIFDVGESFDGFEMPFYECLSTIYVQSLFQTQPDSMVFRFAALEIAGLYHQGAKNSFFMIFRGAPGHSIDSLCSNVDILTKTRSEFLGVIDRTALAFAQLHQFTKAAATKQPTLRLIANSYQAASNELLRRLTGDSEGEELVITGRFAAFLPKIEELKKRLLAEDGDSGTAYLRDMALTHGDAHVGNVFYDFASGQVTFIDYETALKSFQRDADPLKDLGCFLGSVWLKLASMDEQPQEQLYEMAMATRETLVRQYMGYKKEDLAFIEKVLQRVKLYMWNRLFYSGELVACSPETITRIEYFLGHEFE